MKIYIMTDLEGTAGVVDFESQTYPSGKYFEIAKGLATEEVNSACEGAFEAGIEEIFVVDGHGSGGIIPEKIHPDVKLVHGRPLPKAFNLEQGWDAAFLIGHHAMNGTENGNLNHSYSSRDIVRMTLNGKEIGEIGMEIFLAGYFDIPVVLISGDEAGCKEAEMYNKSIEKAVVKWGITRTSAISVSPLKARKIIKQSAQKSIKRINEIKPIKFKGECNLTIEFISSANAFVWQNKAGIEKVSPRTIGIRGDSFIDVWNKFYLG